MISIFKSADGQLETLAEPVAGSWINVANPTAEEIVYLEQTLQIPPDYIAYSLDIDETAKTEKAGGYTLVLLRVPCFQGEASDVPYSTVPVGIVLTEIMLITICRIDLLYDLINGRMKGVSTTKRNRFVLQVLMATANHYLRYVREINRRVDVLEDKLQMSMRNQEVLGLLKYEKSLVYFTTALKSNDLMLQRLQRSQMFQAYPEDNDLLEDVLTEIQQAMEMTNIANNILSQMMDAFASIISNNLNGVMKFLASITIVLTLPTMIASFYGMNVGLPLQGHPNAFLLTLAASVGLSALIALIFVRKDWF